MKSTEKALDNVFVSLIGFASDAKVLLSPTSVNNVDGLINYGSICQADGFTDYQAAGNAATSICRMLMGQKMFILYQMECHIRTQRTYYVFK